MDHLLLLGLLQLLTVPVLSLTLPTQDYWGPFGTYGPCSRSCGSGVAMRTRQCITARTDGGHNCEGSSTAFRICNTQDCPYGSRDFREEQCSQFDRSDFQGKRYRWVPYYGASNPCELNCVPRGENFYYRHRAAVVDGTPCYVGRTDVCVEGKCRNLSHDEFLGLDEDVNSVHSSAPVVPHPSETFSYFYRTGVFGECSANCSGGMQYRSVECVQQDPVNPHVVEESHCVAQRLQRPQSQQTCNMHLCTAEYSISSYSECSVSCGEGEQTRDVVCVGPNGEHLDEQACSELVRPPAVRSCRRPACQLHISWHVTDYGLCSKSCGGGVRERRVVCFDLDYNTYPEDHCGLESRPADTEACNYQHCPDEQMVPSVQDPGYHGSTIRGYVPHVPEVPSVSGPEISSTDHYPPVIGPYCAQSYYGCCPDGHTSATGHNHEGCTGDCVQSSYGCCLDGVTPAQGLGRAGCPESETDTEEPQPPVTSSDDGVCTLPVDEGPCEDWTIRFYYDWGKSKCTEFWYGSCWGNVNNFASMAACQERCGYLVRERAQPAPTARPAQLLRSWPRRVAGILRA